MPAFYYLRGAVGDASLVETHAATIHELIHGTYATGDLERLQGHRDVYSYRVTGSGRLLFTTIGVGGERCLLLLEYLPTHDYHKSRFLRSGVLQRYLLAQGEAMVGEALEFARLEGIPDELRALDKADDGAHVLDYYQQDYIQQEALRVPLPAVISGVAGSGKSCVATLLISNDVQRYHDMALDERRRILYVSQSVGLVQQVEHAWRRLPVAQDTAHVDVQFKTYQDMLAEFPELHDKTFVDQSDVDEWYNTYTERQKAVYKAKGLKEAAFFDLNREDVYQEFRLCAAYSREEYCNLGERQATLPKGNLREVLYKAFEAYQRSLDERHCVNPPFYAIAMRDGYDLVIVDESQDFSHLQLKNLAQLAKHQHIAYCMDSHQMLLDVLSPRPFLLSMLRRTDVGEVPHIELPVSYRCPLQVARAANEMIQAKYRLTGGTADKRETPSIQPNMGIGASKGHVLVLDEQEIRSWAWFNEQTRGAHCAVVTSPEWIEEARRIFGTTLVFTPEGIKGLEYDMVVVYRPFSTAIFKEAYAESVMAKATTPTQYRRKGDEGDETFAPDFNQLFTSFTRAKRTLVICERYKKPSREVAYFLKPLQDIMGNTARSDAEHVQVTTLSDWEDEIMRQIDVGRERLAIDMYRAQFNPNITTEEFKAFVAQKRKRIVPVAGLVEASVQVVVPASTPVVRVPASAAVAKKESPPHQRKKPVDVHIAELFEDALSR